MDLVLNNPQRLICHKIQPTNQTTNQYFCVQKVSYGLSQNIKLQIKR